MLHSLEGHSDGVDNLLLTPDGRLISSCSSSDTTVKVWDVKRGKLLRSLEGLTFSPSRFHFLQKPPFFITTGGHQLTVWRWDTDEQIAQFTADGHILSCEVASDDTIIVGDGLGCVHFLNLIEAKKHHSDGT
jgi:WD40 repeat protein